MALAGVSTLGIKMGWAQGSSGNTVPTSFKKLTRINNIGGIAMSTEQIDVSALEDYVTRYVAGRQDTGGTWTITVNLTDDTIAEWEEVIQAQDTATAAGDVLWFEVWSPYLTDGFFVIAQPPKEIPVPESGQNAAHTVDIELIIGEYKGMHAKVEPA